MDKLIYFLYLDRIFLSSSIFALLCVNYGGDIEECCISNANIDELKKNLIRQNTISITLINSYNIFNKIDINIILIIV